MRDDVERWETKYRRADPQPDHRVDSLLEARQRHLDGNGTALDLAAGACHAAVFLALIGYDTLAVDCSETALAIGQRLARRVGTKIRVQAADLDIFKIEPAAYDLVVCFRYLNRNLFPAMAASLKPNGLLFFKTFNVHHLRSSPSFNPAYLLDPGELQRVFSGLKLIDLDDGEDPAKAQSWIVARRP